MTRSIFTIILGIIITTTNVRAQDTLGISAAIQIGLENNFDIKISEGQRTIVGNNNTYGNAGFLPTLDVDAGQQYNIENTAQKFINGVEQNVDGAKTNNLSASATLNWTLFDGTTMFYTKQRLGELERQGIEITKSVIQNIVSQIAVEFYTVALEQIRLSLLEVNISLSEDRLEIAKNKYDFGKAAKMEYLQAQVDLNRDISNQMIQQEILASSKTTLNELLSRDVTLDFFVVFDPNLNTTLTYESLHESMLQINPELLAVKYDMNAAKLVEKELFGQRIPEIGVNLGYNYSKIEAQAGFLLNRRSNGINYGVTARWNVFDGLNLNRQIQNARIVAENTAINYDAVQLGLERELYSVFISYQNNIQLHRMEQANLEVAKENNEIAIERYRVGNSSPLELREAQINQLEANLRLLNAAYSVKTGEIDLLFLSGLIME